MRPAAAILLAALCAACEGSPASRPDPGSTIPAEASAFLPGDLASSERLPERFGIGRAATPEEIAAIDIDVLPDGRGLPPGRGTVPQGAAVYALQCASCHGANGEGVQGVGEPLAGPTEAELFGVAGQGGIGRGKTIGSYWPYATTLFDYVRRAMPFAQPGSLSDEEVYSLTAYLLHLNGIVPADAVMDAQTLPRVRMPAHERFVPDDRETSTRVR
jgi:S-disulfanyl-L-cysteine oxidoreductase SoxD